MNAGGGYSGGFAECGTNNRRKINGGEMTIPNKYSWCGDGGSYFFSSKYDGDLGENIAGKIGGQGGVCYRNVYWCDAGGDGGLAGNGGIVKVSENARVYAYNGNRFTDGKTEHNFSKDTIDRNQCPIFIQNGVLRQVYKMNNWWNTKKDYNYLYFSNLFKNTIRPNIDKVKVSTSQETTENILVRDEILETDEIKIRSGYKNPLLKDKLESERTITINIDENTEIIDMMYQGVGSGAGYIEISNGKYYSGLPSDTLEPIEDKNQDGIIDLLDYE